MIDLTKRQQEIYSLYYDQGLTQDEIAAVYKCSQPAIGKSLKLIRKKMGLCNSNSQGYSDMGLVNSQTENKTLKNTTTSAKYWRTHGLHFIVKPYYFTPRYYRTLKKRGGYGIFHKKFTITLYEDSVRVQSAEGLSWDHKDKYQSMVAAEQDFNRFLQYAADKYGFRFMKEGRISIKCVDGHLALNGSELSEAANNQYIHCRDREGKVYFIIDQSKGHEHEYIGKRSFEASERIEPYLNDWLYNQPLTNSQLTSRHSDMMTLMERQLAFNEIIKKKVEDAERFQEKLKAVLNGDL